MAAGSHAEKGIWALLVNEAKITNHKINPTSFPNRVSKNIIFQPPKLNNQEILTKIAISPIRLERIVNKPEFNDFIFW